MVMLLTNSSYRYSVSHGDSCHGDVQVQSGSGPTGLLQSLSFSRPESNVGPAHLHTLTFYWPSWLHPSEVQTLCSSLTCPDQVTCSWPIRKQFLKKTLDVCYTCFSFNSPSFFPDWLMMLSLTTNHCLLFSVTWFLICWNQFFFSILPCISPMFLSLFLIFPTNLLDSVWEFLIYLFFVGCYLVALHEFLSFSFLSETWFSDFQVS